MSKYIFKYKSTTPIKKNKIAFAILFCVNLKLTRLVMAHKIPMLS